MSHVHGTIMENEDFVLFLRRRSIADYVIEQLQDEKIDPHIIQLMDEDKLKEYFPTYGDRLAVRDYCSKKSVSSKRKLSIIEKFKKKITSKAHQEIKSKSCIPSTEARSLDESGTKEDTKLLKTSTHVLPKPRQIFLGWIMVKDNKTVQIREKQGGGVRKPSVPRTFIKKDLLNLASEIFFPNGSSSHYGNIENYELNINDFQMNELEENISVGELYEVTKLPHLRFYLTTKERPTPVISVEEETQSINKTIEDENNQNIIVNDEEFSFHEEELFEYNDTLADLSVEHQNQDIVKFDVHRGLVFDEFLKKFKDFDLNSGPLVVRVILPNGEYENAIDVGGVFRDCLTEFWETFYEKCTLGTMYKVPIIRSDFKDAEWRAIGKVLVKGWSQEKYFPINLAPAFIEQCLYGASIDLMESFRNFVSHSGRDLIDLCLKNFSEVDTEDLLEFLQEYENKSFKINSSTICEILKSIAFKEMVQKPMFIINIWRTIMLDMMPHENLVDIYHKMKPTSKNIVQILNGQCCNANETRVFNYLKKYIKESEIAVLKSFLRFCTGSNLILNSKISVSFVDVSGFSRCPVANVCACSLELPSTYESYPEFRSEFNEVLTSNIWIMDKF